MLHVSKRPSLYYDKREICAFSTFLVLVVITLAILLYVQVLQLKIHLQSPDPRWTDFPNSCFLNPTTHTVQNCVRFGVGIPRPLGGDGIDVGLFSAPQTTVFEVFDKVARKDLMCSLVSLQESSFAHYRCLTSLMGYPDDLAIKVFCSGNVTAVWIHSQSRIATWDELFNDYRVRLLIEVINRNYRQEDLSNSRCNRLESPY